MTRWTVVAVLLIALAPGTARCEDSPPTEEPERGVKASPAPLAWNTSLADGYREALEANRPLLAVVGGESCPWCRKLELVLARPEVQAELKRWTRVRIDSQQAPHDAVQLGAASIPALRILTPRGRLVQSHEGYLDEEKLLAWLAAHFNAAVEKPDEVLLSGKEPSLLEVVRLVRQFEDRNAAVREAAVRRLAPYPAVARPAVVKALGAGSLSTRLTSLELLERWQAPVEGVDPWRPETLSEEKLAALEAWSGPLEEGAALQLDKLSPERLIAAQNEIAAMLKAPPAEAAAMRDRLAAFGKLLLPEVYAQLQKAASDERRERLLALRYRLVADDALVLRAPGLIERLAATDSRTRHRAAEELAELADAEQQALLLELFSDPDPLVRELSLQGLKNIGGSNATAALVDLLADPEPNVRAAVLKQLAEDAPAGMLEKVTEYVAQEQDPDLVVHAIRYFKEVKQAAVPSLLPLLKHESWQVRAEAAEAIGKLTDRYRGTPNRQAQDALIEALDDSDAFVVSRALEGLGRVERTEIVEPIIRAAQKHPALAAAAVQHLAGSHELRGAAVPHLREFSKHEDPAVRAAAVSGLCNLLSSKPDEVRDELTAALHDGEARVRIAGAGGVVALLNQIRPDSPGEPIIHHALPPTKSVFSRLLNLFGESDPSETPQEPAEKPQPPDEPPPPEPAEEETDDVQPPLDERDAWLVEVYSGKHRPEWMGELIPPLLSMLDSDESEQRLAAALPLVALGRGEQAVAVLLEVADEAPGHASQAAEALAWLVWPEREKLFFALHEAAANAYERSSIIHQMTRQEDRRAIDLYWQLLSADEIETRLAAALYRSLGELYFDRQFYDVSSATARKRAQTAEAVAPHVMDGPPMKRTVALGLLLAAAPGEAADWAGKVIDDPQADERLKLDAFQILLVSQTSLRRSRTAIEALDGDNQPQKKLAVQMLARGERHLLALREDFELYGRDLIVARSGSDEDVVLEAPKLLKPVHVRPLLDDPDREIAAYAGYLLALLEEPEGLDRLLKYWRESQETDDELDQLVYRAIAALNAGEHVPVLREIYSRLDSEYEKIEFYWTVRSMTGPEILEFRRQIRREVKISL